MNYEHESLVGDRAIRVLKLLPSGRLKKSQLSCELVPLQLPRLESKDQPQCSYEALSYAWEGQIPDRVVSCQGKTLLVTANCEAALNQLRYRTKGRVLWIDSICIDQSSDPEKSQQVQIMGDIYQLAKKVIVWLGDGSPDITRVFSHLSLFQKLSSIKPYFIQSKLQRLLALRIDKIQKLNESQINQLPRTGFFVIVPTDRVLQDVFSRTWFKRMWTLQEVVLSKKCQVQCGSASLPWDILCHLDSYFHMSGKEVGVDGPVEIHRELNRRIGHARGTNYSADQEVRISSILHSTQGKEVTDARDRIFALHGIFSALGLNISPPDYSKDLVQVFSETTARAIEEDKSLSVLNHIVGQSQISKLPSWVPDWNEKSPAWSPLNFFFRPAKDSPLVFEFIQEDRRLCLWGLIIDTIKTCTPTLEVSSFMNSAPIDGESLVAGVRAGIELMKIVLQWIELGLNSKFRKTHEQTFLALLQELLYTDLPVDEYADDFARWLMVFLWKRERREGDTYINLFSRWLIKTVTGEEPEPDPEPDIQPEDPQLTESVSPPSEETLRPAVKHPVDPQTAAWADFYELDNNDFFAEAVKTREFAQFNLLSDNDAVKRFQDYVLRVNRARRLFDTENGRSGTGSAVVHPGDQVVLFSGSRQPMMIRKDATEMYRLLGPAYVDGIMNGQAWDSTWGPENGLEKFIFV